MNTVMEKIGNLIKGRAEAFWALSRAVRIVVLVAVIGVTIAILRLGSAEEPSVDQGNAFRKVTLERVGDLSANTSPIPLLGTVTSRSEATIRTEASGKINVVYKKLGDRVRAGEVIAEFENAGERAQVLQAEGAYEASKAGRDIAGINSGTAGNALSEAKTNALNAITSAYTGLDDAVRTKTDIAWRNPQTRDAKLTVGVSDAKLVIELEQERTSIEMMLRAREERNKTLSAGSDLVSELNTVEAETNTVKNYLDDLSMAFNRALPDGNTPQATIDGYKASTGVARTAVNGILSSLAGARTALNSSIAGVEIAEKSGSISSGGSTADAQLKSALGTLRAAEARLEETIVRSPISGSINSLSIHTGDSVGPMTEVAVVSNNGALEVIAFATEGEQKELSVGAAVEIEGGVSGVVTRVAPALDPKTKKIELRIGITGNTSGLVNGQSVAVNITRTKTLEQGAGKQISIPLSATKLTPNGALVFTVGSDGKLLAHKVTLGTLQGDRTLIIDGLTPDMMIVTDARGLKEGITVATQ